MKKSFAISIILLALPGLLSAIVVNPPSGPYYVGQRIQFHGSDYMWSYTPGILYFGDGTSVSGVTNTSWKTHVYRSPGRYVVRLTSPPGGNSQPQTLYPPDESMVIRIRENRAIEVSPVNPVAGQMITCTAINFNTPDNIRWEMGDGTVYRQHSASSPSGSSVITHVYNQPGSFQIQAYDWEGTSSVAPVSITLTIGSPARKIEYHPMSPRVDQPVYFEAKSFIQSSAIRWVFSDGTQLVNGTNVTHRFQQDGLQTVQAFDGTLSHSPVRESITVLPENRSITLSAPEVRVNLPVTAMAINFRGDFVLWNFGDGEILSGAHQISHVYTTPGTYTISARDENGESTKNFIATVKVVGIDDQIRVEVAEIRLDNGKYYKVVPRKSKSLFAVFRTKMQGTGAVAGQWIVDGHPYEFFNELAVQGELKEIRTRDIPGLPVLDPGLHTITLQLTRPADLNVNFPVLKYYVLPYENVIETIAPLNGFICKEKEIPDFSWKRPQGASRYELAFSNNLYDILYNTPELKWNDVGVEPRFQPAESVWNHIDRNRMTYWKVRALDSVNQVIAESDIREIKVIVATAEIAIHSVTDLEGRPIELKAGRIYSKADFMLLHGSLVYEADTEFLVLRVFANQTPVDRLVFRNVRKGKTLDFETSVPNDGNTRVLLQLLKTSSPAVVVGMKNLQVKRPSGPS